MARCHQNLGQSTPNTNDSGVIGNGVGFAALVARMPSANAAVRARNCTSRGHEVQFPKDTQIEIQLNKQ